MHTRNSLGCCKTIRLAAVPVLWHSSPEANSVMPPWEKQACALWFRDLACAPDGRGDFGRGRLIQFCDLHRGNVRMDNAPHSLACLLLLTCCGAISGQMRGFRECDGPQCSVLSWDSRINWEDAALPPVCEMELLYEVAGVTEESLGSRISLINNLEEDVVTWQVVWTFNSFRDIAVDSTKGAILLSPGSAFGAPVRVVNTQKNAGIKANGSRTEFSIAAQLDQDSSTNTPLSLDIRGVSVNGMRCLALDSPVCGSSSCSDAQPSPTATQTPFSLMPIFSPECSSFFCCGSMLNQLDSESEQGGGQCALEPGSSPGDMDGPAPPPFPAPDAGTDGPLIWKYDGPPQPGKAEPSDPSPSTFPEPTPPQTSPPPVPETPHTKDSNDNVLPAIISSAGGAVIIAVVALGFALHRRKRHEKSSLPSSSVELMKNASELRCLNLSLHAATSAGSSDWQEIALDLANRIKQPRGESGSEPSVILRTVSEYSGRTEAPERDCLEKTGSGLSVSKNDKSQGDFEIDFSKDVRLLRKLGSGAFGTVFQGTWNERHVAVKMVSVIDMGGCITKELESLKCEIEVLSRLAHPNIICFYGACLMPPHVCIVEELAAQSLATKLHGNGCSKEHKALPYGELLKLGLDIASAMAYLHPSVVHRDLKPQNVLLDASGRAKVCDFGIAKFKDSTFMSTKNVTAGTPAYMAPEMFEGNALDEKVDVFSFAVMMWECYTGQSPWQEYYNPMQIIYAVGVQGRRLPVPAECPPFLANLITRCWDRDPKNRPAFTVILDALQEELNHVNWGKQTD